MPGFHAAQYPPTEPVTARDPDVAALLDALTSELALGGYSPEETFGYSVEQLEQRAVHLVGPYVHSATSYCMQREVDRQRSAYP